ncbi:gp235 [Sphingomonas phage PAU]|uniref:gp235 n=1 Tax=Sphingomonas phage PAU TaxID=1150991 RepID=UPI0002573389|nr:gp235 [Sphingomonas phage PAU]AFF28233.1 gp235 [Sphingomonas phage PAU]
MSSIKEVNAKVRANKIIEKLEFLKSNGCDQRIYVPNTIDKLIIEELESRNYVVEDNFHDLIVYPKIK